jgi:SEC-C motif-containing protein
MNGNVPSNTPAELILARNQAFRKGDFGFIYDSYHSESNFRQQFLTRNEYLHFGRTCLSQDYRILKCQILAEKVSARESQVVFLIEMKVRGLVQLYAELAWLRCENAAWRYHRGQKMTAEDLPEDYYALSFSDFDKLDPATIF